MDETAKRKDELERLRLRSSQATAQGGQAYTRLLTLAETRNSGQIARIARRIASTDNDGAYSFDRRPRRSNGINVPMEPEVAIVSATYREIFFVIRSKSYKMQ